MGTQFSWRLTGAQPHHIHIDVCILKVELHLQPKLRRPNIIERGCIRAALDGTLRKAAVRHQEGEPLLRQGLRLGTDLIESPAHAMVHLFLPTLVAKATTPHIPDVSAWYHC